MQNIRHIEISYRGMTINGSLESRGRPRYFASGGRLMICAPGYKPWSDPFAELMGRPVPVELDPGLKILEGIEPS